MTIFIVDIEAVDTRYTKQWKEYLPKQIGKTADDVIVMYQGKIVEQGSVASILNKPKHPYTKALLQCVPDALGKKTLKPIDYKKLERAMASI